MTRRTLAILLLIPFLPLSLYAVYQSGYVGLFDYQLQHSAGWQVLADLVVACVLLLSWIVPEAKRNGQNPWPVVVMTVFLGSFGPLFYIIFMRKSTSNNS